MTDMELPGLSTSRPVGALTQEQIVAWFEHCDAIQDSGKTSTQSLHLGMETMRWLLGLALEQVRPPTLSFWLPWPTSVNAYWRFPTGCNHPTVSARGRNYRNQVSDALLEQGIRRRGINSRLGMSVQAMPPEVKRERDLDNLLKATQDGLQHVGVYKRDSQIDVLHVERGEPYPDGRLLVALTELEKGGVR